MSRIAPIWLSVFGMLVVASPAGATTKDWNDVSGNWANGGSWTPIGVPAAGDNVNIVFGDDVARTVTYDYAGPDITLGTLTLDMVGLGTNGVTLTMAANSLKTAATTIGSRCTRCRGGRGCATAPTSTRPCGRCSRPPRRRAA